MTLYAYSMLPKWCGQQGLGFTQPLLDIGQWLTFGTYQFPIAKKATLKYSICVIQNLVNAQEMIQEQLAWILMDFDSVVSLLIDWTIVTASFPRCDFTENTLKVQAQASMEKKGTGKGRLWVLQHCCLLRHIVILPERVPSFISRGATHTKRRERPLLAKEGNISGI
jgi:hypothetical protein